MSLLEDFDKKINQEIDKSKKVIKADDDDNGAGNVKDFSKQELDKDKKKGEKKYDKKERK